MTQFESIASVATGRDKSFLLDDMKQREQELKTSIKGKRILAIGAAGSIGSATVEVMADFEPSSLHVIDHNENELAELVRGLRSRKEGLSVEDFRTLPVDYGSPATRMFLHDQASYDIVLNFAAIKHVRSEKDVYSMLQMFDTNFRKQAQLLKWLSEIDFQGRYFSVSTDKAANPSSVMGASKRVMEHVMFDGHATGQTSFTVTSARFANVAFSNGSLLESFGRRLERREPMACPKDTKRYFVSLEESGQLCTLAALCAPNGAIVIPNLDPEDHLVPLEDVAFKFLEKRGLTPSIYTDEVEAQKAVEKDFAKQSWPLILTNLNTVGEKPYEEFIGANETVTNVGFQELSAIMYQESQGQHVSGLLETMNEMLESAQRAENPKPLDKNTMTDWLASVEPEFAKTYRSSDQHLDSRI